jgi:hypothetical protein
MLQAPDASLRPLLQRVIDKAKPTLARVKVRWLGWRSRNGIKFHHMEHKRIPSPAALDVQLRQPRRQRLFRSHSTAPFCAGPGHVRLPVLHILISIAPSTSN